MCWNYHLIEEKKLSINIVMKKGWKTNRIYYVQLFCTCFIIKISDVCGHTILIDQINHVILKTNNLDRFLINSQWSYIHLSIVTNSYNPLTCYFTSIGWAMLFDLSLHSVMPITLNRLLALVSMPYTILALWDLSWRPGESWTSRLSQ